MTWDSISFIYLFLPVSILLFRLIPQQYRTPYLAVISWAYYMFAGFSAFLILAANCLLDFVLLGFLDIYSSTGRRGSAYGLFAGKAAAVLLLVLFYSHFQPGAALGIFVYTATLLGYLWDLYRGQAQVFYSFWDYAVFTTFFGKAGLGPVVRYQRFVPQLAGLRSSATAISRGAVWFVTGLAKKVVIASGTVMLYQDLAGIPVEEYTLFSAWALVFSAAMSIFFTISAYSDMARGLCSMFSLEVPRIIYYPYQAKSFVECVSRINMSLYDLVLDVVSGSAESVRPLKRYRQADAKELAAVFAGVLVVGVWLQPSPAMLLWALFLFGMILAERYLYFGLIRYLPGILQSAFTFVVFLVSLVPLVSPTIWDSGTLLSTLMGFSGRNMVSDETGYYIASNYLAVLLSLLFFTSGLDRLAEMLSRRFPTASEWMAALFNCTLLVVSTAMLI
ncbi:MAG: hypothetical protein KH009_01415 [Clostridiales bacterium]|nr:hypothetical protein [Clostridiales bacterium]